MCDFKRGDEVVCIDAKPDSLDPLASLLAEGRVYVVANCGLRDTDGELSVCFECIPGSVAGRGYAFTVRRFRKVQRRDLTAWLATAAPVDPALPSPPRPARRRERERA